MSDDADRQGPDGPSRAARRARRALVFVVVLVAAGLLGRLGSGVDEGPAVEVEQSAAPSPGALAG